MNKGEYEALRDFVRTLLSTRVCEYRLSCGLSQEKMAEKLFVSSRAYGNLERGVFCFSALPLMSFFSLFDDETRKEILIDFSDHAEF